MFKKIPQFQPAFNWSDLFYILKENLLPRAKQQGCSIEDFEKVFSRYAGVQNAVFIPSGRIGLWLILKYSGLPKQSQIILPAFSFWVIPRIIESAGYFPIYVDVDPATCNMDDSLIEKCITKSTRAIIVTHLYGLPNNMAKIMEIAERHNLFVIEDCVQSCGAEYKGRKTGSFGNAAYFSFGLTKSLSVLSGGMAVTSDNALAQRIRNEAREFKFFGKAKTLRKILVAMAMKFIAHPYIYSFSLYPLAYLFSLANIDIIKNIFSENEKSAEPLAEGDFSFIRPDTLAKPALRQLKALDSIIERRIHNAGYLLRQIDGIGQLRAPDEDIDKKNVFTNFALRFPERDKLALLLFKKGLDSSTGYMKCFADDKPYAKAVQENILHIPIYPFLTKNDLEYIADSIKEAIKKIRNEK